MDADTLLMIFGVFMILRTLVVASIISKRLDQVHDRNVDLIQKDQITVDQIRESYASVPNYWEAFSMITCWTYHSFFPEPLK